MAITKADTITSTSKQKEIYSDFLDSFAVSPIGGVLAKVTNQNSVKQSIKNLILTNLGERLYQPLIGGNIRAVLFEPNNVLSENVLRTDIENVIEYYEPRAREVQVTVKQSDDNHSFFVNIVFYTINNPDPIDLSLNLKRIR